MKKIAIVSVLVFMMCGAAAAQSEKHLSSAPREFRTFVSKFLGAVRRGDKVAVAGMARFPLSFGFDTGDEGKMTRTKFYKRFRDFFGKSPSKFVPERDPEYSREGGTYSIITKDAAQLNFEKRNGKFYLVSYVVEP